MLKHLLYVRNTHGSVLVIGMLTLVLLSLIGVSSTQTSRIEIEISANDKAQKEAFFAAEFGLTSGEDKLEVMPDRVSLNESSTIGHYAEDTAPLWYAIKWDGTDSVGVPDSSVPSGLDRIATPPRYVLEQRTFRRDSLTTGIGVPTGIYYFNVFSQGTDSSGTGKAVLKTIYAKRFN